MIFNKRQKKDLEKGAGLVNEINYLYSKGEVDKAELLKKQLRKIRSVDLVDIINRATTLRGI